MTDDYPKVRKYTMFEILVLRFMAVVFIALWHILGKLRFETDEYVTIRKELDNMAKEYQKEIMDER